MTGEAAVAGKVLWEVSDPTMGFSYGTLVMVKTRKHGWTLILPRATTTATITATCCLAPGGCRDSGDIVSKIGQSFYPKKAVPA